MSDPLALANVASGVLMGLLGLGLLATRPRKNWNRVFGLFALFWGVQIVTANAVRIVDDVALAQLSAEVSLAFLLPLYFFLVAFADLFPSQRAPFGTQPVAIAGLALPAAVAAVVLFVEPSLLLDGVEPLPGGGFTFVWGPLLPFLVTAPFYGGFSYALYAMMDRLETAATPTERKQVSFVLAALGFYLAYAAPTLLVAFAGPWLGLEGVPEAAGAEALVISAVLLGALAILLLVGLRLYRRVREGPYPVQREARLALGALASAGAAAAVVIVLNHGFGAGLRPLGLFRSGSVALIVYGIVRYQLFDLDLRAKRWAAQASAALAVVGLVAAVWQGLEHVDLSGSLRAATTGLVGALALLPTLHVSYRVADRIAPGISREGDHLYLRKLEVYRAAVEDRLVDDEPVEPDSEGLARLRDRLGLTDRDHGVVVTLASSGAEPREVEPDLRPGRTAFGKYELEAVLDTGSFGRALLARDTMLGRRVVIKELLAKWRESDAVVQRFLQEARIAGQLNHPNIVSVYDVEQHGGDYYIVMEHVPGGSLAERIGDGRLPLDRSLDVALDVLDGLQAAHQEGVVHRDVKPANILLGERGEAKLTDFGIANLTREGPDQTLTGLDGDNSPAGTPQYMAPEQAAGEATDERADLYAVGAVLYRALTGRPHVDLQGLDGQRARDRVAQGPQPPPVDELPEALAPVVERALAPDPSDRFASAAAFREALAEAREEPVAVR